VKQTFKRINTGMFLECLVCLSADIREAGTCSLNGQGNVSLNERVYE